MWFRRGYVNRKSERGGEIYPEEILLDAVNLEDFDTGRLEGQIEFSLGKTPFIIFTVIAVLGIGILAIRAGILGIARTKQYAAYANQNRAFSISLPAPRGIIYDRNKKPLVQNSPSFEAVLQRNEIPDDKTDREILLANLAKILHVNSVDITAAGFDPKLPKNKLPLEIVIASDIPREEAVALESAPDQFPGLVVRERAFREYLSGPAFFHVIGYVGKNETSTKNADSDVVGKSGIESVYDAMLHGTPGEKLIEVNASHAKIGELPEREPQIGKSLVLNIDAGLQKVLYQSLGSELEAQGRTSGSAVVLDPRNGAIRALVSFPSLDPNTFRKRLSASEYVKLVKGDKPFFDRAISGEYPSGSVIKPMMAIAALQERIIDPSFKIYDPGYISVPNPYVPGQESVFHDWQPQGWVDMRAAIEWSADVYFYIVGGGYKNIKGLGISKIEQYMRKFGLGSKLGVDLPGETSGLVAGPDNIAKTRPRDPVWRLGDTYHVSIGQGSFQATPLQIAAMTAAVANGGTLWQPQVVSQILDERGNAIQTIQPRPLATNLGDPASFQIVHEGMRLVATAGTAHNFFSDFPIEVAGKTGTAQTGFEKNAHGWFTVFAPYQNPELVIVVMAENAVPNSGIATRVTKDILNWYFFERGSHSM